MTARQSLGSALTFVAGGERLAIAASAVSEVVRSPTLARLPLSPPGLAGVVSLRGQVIPVIALSRLLHGVSHAPAGEARVIVVEDESRVGLLVDEVAALVPGERLGTPEERARLIDLPALIASEFGSAASLRAPRGAARLASSAPASAPVAVREYLSFDVSGQEFALPLSAVLEVVALPPEIARLPRTDQAMRGVMALRNRLLPLLNLDVLLGLGGAEGGAARRVVVARLGETRVGLIIERTRAIVRVPETQVDPVPPVLTRGNQETQVQSVGRLEDGRRLISILSTDHLLRDGLAERIREQVSREDSDVQESAATAGTEQFLQFKLGENRFGLPIACVEEVARVPERLSPLPKAPPFVDGVIELRGRVVPVIDQRRRFVVPETASAQRRIVVVRIGSASAGFVVDNVSGIVRLAAGEVQDSPELAMRDNRTVHRVGVAADGGMLFLIDPQELLDKAERDMVAAMQKDPAANS